MKRRPSETETFSPQLKMATTISRREASESSDASNSSRADLSSGPGG